MSVISLGLILYAFDKQIEANSNMELALVNADSATVASMRAQFLKSQNISLMEEIELLRDSLEANCAD